jgi:hypothetical protein
MPSGGSMPAPGDGYHDGNSLFLSSADYLGNTPNLTDSACAAMEAIHCATLLRLYHLAVVAAIQRQQLGIEQLRSGALALRSDTAAAAAVKEEPGTSRRVVVTPMDLIDALRNDPIMRRRCHLYMPHTNLPPPTLACPTSAKAAARAPPTIIDLGRLFAGVDQPQQ